MLKRVVRNLEEIVSCTALSVVILSVVWSVVTRWVLRRPAAWCDELAAVTFTWAVFMGAGAAFKRGLHIGIDMLVKNVPAGLRVVLETLAYLVILAFCLFMVVYGLMFSLNAYKQPTSVLRIPNTYFYISVPVAFAFMAVHQLRVAVRALLPRRGEAGQ